ncbi:MAG TPA: class I SAM-dependent methyltransferase [Burkholderiaceae bacterium]|nr:class I SAM-dependent methyltransferase [Burkholderiaceae bacterium]
MWIARGLISDTRIAKHAVHSGVKRLAESIIATGGAALEVTLPDGSRIGFGLPARIRLFIRDQAMLTQLANATLASLAEAYVDGRIDVQGNMLEAVPLAEQIAAAAGSHPAQRAARVLFKHSSRRDRAAIGYHYDVGNEFYRLWLDERMVYSCAYFKSGNEAIDEAQRAKLDHICRKLQLAPGERLLDVGCGWGGLILHAARHYGVRAVGITLSQNQFELACKKIAAENLADQVTVLLLDYRELKNRFGANSFDKVASVGMFEHVGLGNLREYFAAVSGVVRDRGLFLNHGITSADLDGRPIGSGIGDFVQKHVFPHGELPHLHVVAREMSRAGFEIVDVESLRAHYAKTLAHWSRRLDDRLADAARLVTDRTLRIWRAYLAGSAYGFAQGWMSVHQLLGSRQARPGATDLPLTRDYMYR